MNDTDLQTKILLNKSSKPNTEEIMNTISTNSGCGPHFLEAYCKIADKELEKMKETDKKLKKKL